MKYSLTFKLRNVGRTWNPLEYTCCGERMVQQHFRKFETLCDVMDYYKIVRLVNVFSKSNIMKYFVFCVGMLGVWTVFYTLRNTNLEYLFTQNFDKIIFGNNNNYYNTQITKVEYEFGYKGKCPDYDNIYARSKLASGFGNHLMEYASAWGVAKLYNVTAIVTDQIFANLKVMFEDLSLSSVSSFVDNLDGTCARKITKYFSEGPATKSMDEVSNLLLRAQHVVLRPNIILVDVIVPARSAMREEFKFRPKYLAYAQHVLRVSSGSLNNFNGDPSQITYVGVHARRKDYHRYLRVKFGLRNVDLASVKYFLLATDLMIKNLNERGKEKIVFLVVSDDKKWSTSTLVPKLHQHFQSRQNNSDVSVQWRGSRNYREDFALLSNCNHSILTYGTFGMSTALLAGGLTIVYDISLGKNDKFNAAMHFARDIPEWTSLS